MCLDHTDLSTGRENKQTQTNKQTHTLKLTHTKMDRLFDAVRTLHTNLSVPPPSPLPSPLGGAVVSLSPSSSPTSTDSEQANSSSSSSYGDNGGNNNDVAASAAVQITSNDIESLQRFKLLFPFLLLILLHFLVSQSMRINFIVLLSAAVKKLGTMMEEALSGKSSLQKIHLMHLLSILLLLVPTLLVSCFVMNRCRTFSVLDMYPSIYLSIYLSHLISSHLIYLIYLISSIYLIYLI